MTDDRANDNLRILVVDESAVGTDQSLAVVPIGDFQDTGTALAALR